MNLVRFTKQSVLSEFEEELTLEEQNMIVHIIRSLNKAKTDYPDFGMDDIVCGTSVVADEAGQLQRAAFEFIYKNGMFEAIEEEAVHTAVTAIRMMLLCESKRFNAFKLKKTKKEKKINYGTRSKKQKQEKSND